MKNPNKKNKFSTCIYCKEYTNNITIDHVVPLAFYKHYKKGKSLPENFYLKVPACKKCNNIKSQNDERFRNLIAVTSAHKSDAAEVLIPTLRRSIDLNKSFQEQMDDSNLKPVLDPISGESLLQFNDVGFEPFSYIEDLVKAIYFIETKNIFDKTEYEIKTIQYDPYNRRYFNPKDKWIKENGYSSREFTEDTIFQYLFKIDNDHVFFLLCFFEYVNFIAVMEPI